MPTYRKTAIVQLVVQSGAEVGSLPLTCEREYGVYLTVEGKQVGARSFRSPLNDEQWRVFVRQMRECNRVHDQTGYNGARAVRAVGRALDEALRGLSPVLEEFLGRTGAARRVVIATTRPELHLLPWGAMNDREGRLEAAGDLSVVQAWDGWEETARSTGSRLRVVTVMGETQRASAGGLGMIPPEVAVVEDATAAFERGGVVGRENEIDVLHLEEHGDAALGEVADVRATALPGIFGRPTLALLWSCYSGAANSWGQSPALCLHREGAGLVLSFAAELHNADAKGISQELYGDVFGPAASRDPEGALVRIRAKRFAAEFEYANWASMTVYLRSPVDMGAIALNGPRVQAAGWRDAGEVSGVWATVAERVKGLQPGSVSGMDVGAVEELPREAFAAWRGNVVQLNGGVKPLDMAVLRELNIAEDREPRAHAAERLVWFFERIARYGAPLIVWRNASPRHAEFLKTIEPAGTLTFLLLYGAEERLGVAELVERNRLAEARVTALDLGEDARDEDLSAAYYSFVRGEEAERAEEYLNRIRSLAERTLLAGNFASRMGRIPRLGAEGRLWVLSGVAQRLYQEDRYRCVVDEPGEEDALRERGRAKHELGYLMSCSGMAGAAELLYAGALEDLERSAARDTRWRSALANALRDSADLLSKKAERLDEARRLLRRAMAIYAFHGATLALAYGMTTAAEIARAACRHSEAIELAVDAANRFEAAANWRGWRTAMRVLFAVLAETRETRRMLGMSELAVAKLEGSNLPPEQREEMVGEFLFAKANAHWIAGELVEAREALQALREATSWSGARGDMRKSADAMWAFLAV